GAMDRLTARQNASGDQGSSKVEGFEASVHRIKEQVLPRLLERVDPEAAATLNKDELAEEFRPIISEVLAELKITLNRREQFALDMMRGFGSMSEKMATVLKIAGASRMNVVISGGTGSGKTTMLNALSKMIDPGERVITIEDAAELRLQQPHWLPLETRPANLEGQGAITIRDLVINALRMRPDRIILGE